MAGTVTVNEATRAMLKGNGTPVISVKLDYIADATDGSFPDASVSNVGGYLVAVYFKPGSTIPTSGVDLSVKMDEIDLLGGNGADLSTSDNSNIPPVDKDDNIILAPFAGDLTVSLSGNSVNSATATVYLLFSV